MKPSKFIAYQERRIGRPLSAPELATIERARLFCREGRSEAVKAMWEAVQELGL